MEEKNRARRAAIYGVGSWANRTHILNEYHDELSSLGSILAGWVSARLPGECIEVAPFVEA